jgi:hypothetical protein
MRRLVAVQAAVNVALLWLGYYWLGLGEATAAALLWSAVVAFAIVVGTCWQYGAALAWFRTEPKDAWRQAVYNLAPLVAFAVVAAAVYAALLWWQGYSEKPAFTVASFLTLKLRVPVKPAGVLRACNVVLWLVWWVVVPVALLPGASAVAAGGWRGFREVASRVRQWRYWLQAPACMLGGFWLPWKLIAWAPLSGSFALEAASFTARALVAFTLLTCGWLLAARVSAAGGAK